MAALIIIAVIVVLAIVAVTLGNRFEQKRLAALQVVASQLKLEFTTTDETGLQSGFAGFNLFNYGRDRRIKNIAYGRLGDVEVMVFEYLYITGTGKNRQTYSQTVGFFQSEVLAMPEFAARPEGLFDKIGQAFGSKDIDLPGHPELSRRFVLRGPDEQAVRDFFTSGVVAWFERNTGLSVEAKSDRFIVYRSGGRLKPEQWREWLGKGMEALEVFSR